MTILRNSCRCVHCGVEIESRYRHHAPAHICTKMPRTRRRWSKDADGKDVLVDVPGEVDFNFFTDGGRDYIRRGGYMEDFVDTSVFSEDHDHAKA